MMKTCKRSQRAQRIKQQMKVAKRKMREKENAWNHIDSSHRRTDKRMGKRSKKFASQPSISSTFHNSLFTFTIHRRSTKFIWSIAAYCIYIWCKTSAIVSLEISWEHVIKSSCELNGLNGKRCRFLFFFHSTSQEENVILIFLSANASTFPTEYFGCVWIWFIKTFPKCAQRKSTWQHALYLLEILWKMKSMHSTFDGKCVNVFWLHS